MLILRIREIREAKGMNQMDLANKAGLTQGYLSELENGIKNNPSADTLQRLASALGVTVSELLDEEPPAKAV